MGKIFGKVFGGTSSSSSVQPTGFQTLPSEAQNVFINDFLGATGETDENGNPIYTSGSALDLFNQPSLFETTPFNDQILSALDVLGSGVRSSSFGGDENAGGLFRAGTALQDARNFVDLLPNQQQRSNNFLDKALGLVGEGADQVRSAGKYIADASGFNDAASGFLRDASGNISSGTSDITDQQFADRFARFNNPFITNVVDAFAGDVKRNAGGLFSDINSNATLDNSFGSTRQAVERAELGRNIADVIGNKSAALRSEGFNTAATLAQDDLQSLRARALQGAGLNINQAGTALNQGNLAINQAGTAINQGNATANLAGTAVSGANSAQNAGRILLDASKRLSDLSGETKDLRQVERGETLDNAELQLKVGELLRNLESSKNQEPFARLQFLQNILGAFPTGGGGTSKSEGTSDQSGNIIGTAATLSAIFSDERLKDNIEFVRNVGGVNVYRFNYADDDTRTFEGVIAQEIQETHPEAVIEDQNGFLKVDYSMLPVDMVEVAA